MRSGRYRWGRGATWIRPEPQEPVEAVFRCYCRELPPHVHLDVCNGVNCPKRFYENSEFIGECFSKLGHWIVSCHSKDLQWVVELNAHFLEVIPGRGQIDYSRYLTELSRLSSETPLMMEHLKTPEEYQEAAHHIRGIGAINHLSFL